MVNHTRLDCVLGSTALMRARGRRGDAPHGPSLRLRPVARRPATDAERARRPLRRVGGFHGTALRLARAFDEADAPFRRLAHRRRQVLDLQATPPLVAEALECLGGNGFVEESQLPRLFRESPLNSIWEGSGNVNALDVLRALAREPESAEAFLAEVRLAEGADSRLDATVARLERELAEPDEEGARRLLELLAVSLQGSLLVRHGAPEVADAFCASRLDRPGGVFGTLPASLDLEAIVERHRPQL